MPRTVTLTRRARFSAAHRYFRPEWDDQKNELVFGDNVRIHGHNYVLEATVAGEVDAVTGMAADIGLLDRRLEVFASRFGYRELTAEAPGLEGRVPTTENLALLAWEHLAGSTGSARLVRVRLFESPELYVDVTAERVS